MWPLLNHVISFMLCFFISKMETCNNALCPFGGCCGDQTGSQVKEALWKVKQDVEKELLIRWPVHCQRTEA